MRPFGQKNNLVKEFEMLVKQNNFESAIKILVKIQEQNLLSPEVINEYNEMCLDGYATNLFATSGTLFEEKKYEAAKEYSNIVTELISQNLEAFKLDRDLFSNFSNKMVGEMSQLPNLSMTIEELKSFRIKYHTRAEEIFKNKVQVSIVNMYTDSLLRSALCGSMKNKD